MSFGDPNNPYGPPQGQPPGYPPQGPPQQPGYGYPTAPQGQPGYGYPQQQPPGQPGYGYPSPPAFPQEPYGQPGPVAVMPGSVKAARVMLFVLGGFQVLGGLLMMIPFFWMVITSLKTRAEVFVTPPTLIPIVPQWHNYADMWNALPFASFFLNSFKLAILNTVGQLVSCSMAAFAFER